MASRQVEEELKDRKISQIINPRLVQAPPSVSVKDAIALMQKNKSGYVIIAERGKLTGLFTETDVTFKILGEKIKWDTPISEFMNTTPPIASPDDTVYQAMVLMVKSGIYHLPLINSKQELVNVITVRTLIRYLAGFYPTEIYNLPPNLDQIMRSPEGG